VRTCTAAAAVPAMVVVIAHLAYVWQEHPSSAARRDSAFSHGVGLAAILAAVLAAARVAQWLEGSSRLVWPGVIGVVGGIAVLSHLADDWRPGGAAVSSVHILLLHLALFLAVAAAAYVAGRLEDAARAGQPPPVSG
jgi:hypothetical protein